MATVTLRKGGPRRLHTKGITFQRDVPQEDVPRDIAEALYEDGRFLVRFNANEANAASAQEAVAAQTDPEDGETDKRIKPQNLQARYAAINEAADQLDLDNEANFTKEGKPDARALSAILGWVVTSKDRDEALKSVAPPAETPKKVASNVTIRRKAASSDELTDTGADAANQGEEDPTTDDAVEV